MKSSYKRIGDYIKPVKDRNRDLQAKELLGININKHFMPSVANIVGTDLSNYKLVQKHQFACNRMHVGRDYRIPVAVSNSEEPFMVSPAYDVFEIKDTSKLDPEYLMMWFSRSEFDRNAWFYTDADVRGGLAWQALEDMKLPVPHIDKQREIVKEYNVIQNRIALNQQMIQKLEETAQAIYKQWFVEFEFPCLPSDYRPHGQVNLSAEFKSIMTYKKVGGLPVPDGKSWFAYVLLCDDGSFYKGMTNDLYRRFYDHYTGNGSEWTKANKPVKVIHWEQFFSQEEAAKREKELKSGYGRTWLQRQWAKVNGGSPAPECQLRMAGEMVWCEDLGKEIPKGWEYGSLFDLIELQRGFDLPTQNRKTGTYPIFASTGTNEKHCEFKVRAPGIVTGRSGSLGEVFYVDEDFWPLNTTLWVKHFKKATPIYSYYVLKGINIIDYNGGSAVPTLNRNDIHRHQLIVPEKKVIDKFEKIQQVFFRRVKEIEIENQKLSELKELLLSKLATMEG